MARTDRKTERKKGAHGPFITRVIETLENGHMLISFSRRHRKQLPPHHITKEGRRVLRELPRSPWLRLWAPGRIAWWVAVLFVIGSACFAYGGLAVIRPQSMPPWMTAGRVVNLVYFVGSVFFTVAAWLQLVEAVNGDVADLALEEVEEEGQLPSGWRWFAWNPHNAGYLSSLIQFLGAVLFNFNTGDAMLKGLSWVGEDVLVWTPDMLGSFCFIAASYLAVVEVSHAWWSFEPRQVSWWVVMINLVGSLAFQASAVYAFEPPTASDWEWNANLWTFVGALCFFVASYLMIPEQFDADASAPSKAMPSPANA
jgi:hypothetical protein